MSCISVILYRDAEDSSQDDVIKIYPADDKNLFVCSYTEKHSNIRFRFTDSWDESLKYLALALSALPYDADPFCTVQFNIPSYPPVSVKVKNLEKSPLVKIVFDQMDSLRRGWPQLVNLDREDSDSESESECESLEYYGKY